MANNSIKYSVGFNVDKSELNQIKSALQEIQKMTVKDLININGNQLQNATQELAKIKNSANELEGAFKQAFNADLGTINVTKFNAALKNLDLQRIHNDLSKAGVAGQNAFRNMTTQVLTTNMQLKQTHSLLDNMATTMANTVKWGVTSSIFNNITGSVQQAYGYVKSLDSSLNDIRIVTGKSAEEMDKFAVKANNAAKALGKSTTDYTKASLIYYQQGLSEQDVNARAETTLKAANVTGQSTDAVSEQLTAVWNGYKVSAEEAELYIDKLAAVAATTASDLEELSTGMSKVASAAATMGVDVDQLNAQLATIVSVTRQAPESVGTALKTIYARMSDLKLGGKDEDGLGLGDVSGQMEKMGIEVLDGSGNLRDMGEVIEDVAGKWDTWTEAQKTAMAQVMAGKRQYNNLMALFENWDMYEDALNTSANAAGTLQAQQDTYMESTAAHLNQLKASTEDLYDSLLDPDGLNPLIDGLRVITDGVTAFVDGIGGGAGVLLNFGSIGAKVFSKHIAQGIATSITNIRAMKDNAAQLSAQMEVLQQFKGIKTDDSSFQKLVSMKEEILQLGNVVTAEQHNEANAIMQTTNELQNKQEEWKQSLTDASAYIQKVTELKNVDLTGIELNDDLYLDALDGLNAVDEQIGRTKAEISKYTQYLNEASKAQAQCLNNSTAENSQAEAKAFQNLGYALDECCDEMLQLSKNSQLTGNQQKELTEAVRKYKEAMKSDNADSAAEAEKLLAVYSKVTGQMENDAKRTRAVLEGEAGGASQKLQKDIDTVQQKWTQFINQLKLTQQIQQVVNLVSSIGQLASAINTIKNIGDIIDDDTLSDGEKALRIITALTMAIPMLVNGLSGMSSSLIKLATISSPSAAKAIADLTTKAGGASVGIKGIGIAIKSLATGPVGIILGIVAAIGLIGYAAYKSYNQARDEAKKATEAFQRQKEVLESVKAANDELSSCINQYHEAKDAIGELTVGTQEWVNAINNANDSVLSLLEKYPELAQYVDNVNGELIVQEDGFKAIQELQEKRLMETQKSTYIAQANMLDKKNISDMTDAGRAISYYDKDAAMYNEYDTGYRTVSQGTIEQVVEAINTSGSGFLKDVESVQEKLGISNEYLAQALVDNASELTTLAGKIEANTAAMDLYYQSLADTYLKDNQVYQKSDNQAGLQAAYGKRLEEEAAKLYESDYKDKWGGKTDAEIQKEYAELIGATDVSNEGKNKGKYLIDGEWKEIDDATARLALATDAAAKTLENFCDDLIPLVDGLSGDTKVQDAILGFANGGTGDLSQLSEEQLSELQSIGLTDEQATTLGYETAEAFTQAVNDAIANEENRRVEQSYKQAEELAHIVDNQIANTQGISSDALKAYQEAGSVYGLSQAAGVNLDDYKDKGISPEQILTNIDFSQMPTENLAEWWKNAIEEGAQKAELQNAKDQEMANLDASIEEFDLDVESVQNYADNLKNIATESDKVADCLANDEIAAKKVAIANSRLNKGLDDLQDNFEDQAKALKENENHTQEYADAMAGLKDAMGDVLNIDGSALSNDFITNNLEDIEAAANGDVEAIERLRVAAAQDIIQQIAVNIDDEELVAQMNEITNTLSTYAMDNKLEIGARVDTTDFINSLNEMITQSGMTAEQVGNYLKALGYDAEVSSDTTKVDSVMQVPSTTYKIDYDDNGNITGMTPEVEIKDVPYEQIVNTPVVKALTYTGSAGGTVNHSNTSAGGASTKSGKKGGGGGSKPKTKEKKSNDDVDKYHEVNTQIEKLNGELSKLQKQQKKLVGPDLINNLNQQLEILEKQKAAQQAKLQIALAEAQVLRATLAAQGAAFNADGTIANFTSLLQAKLDYVNMLIQQYNAMTAAEQEAFESTIEQAQKDYETLKSQMEQYDTLISSTIPDIEAAIQDIVDQEIEIQIQKFNLRMEIVLDVAEAEREFNEFKRRIIDGIKDDDIVGVAKARLKDFSSYYKKDGTGSIQEGTKHVNDIMRELEIMNKGGTSSVYGDDRARALEDLQKYYQQLMEDLEAVQDMVEEIEESYIEMIEKADEEFQKQIELYEHITGLIEHDMNVIKLVYGDSSYDKLIEYYDKQTENNLNQLDFLKLEKQFWEEQMAAEEEGSEAWQAAKEQWLDATNSLNDAIASSIENLQAKYSNAINAIFDNLNNKITGGKGLDYINEEWTLINKNADMYLDKVNSMYEIQKLENKLQESIDNTTSLYAQEKLNELLDDELAKLREKDKLTQYEVDRANMLYEIALKEIALEEAQQNKSQMKLRRDSQGNYSYQYVADSDKVGAAEQELQDAQNSLYNLDKDAYQQNLDEMLALWTEFQEKMAEAAMINDPQLRAERELLIKEQYGEMINNLASQNEFIRLNLQDSTFTELANMYNLDVQNFQAMSDEEQAILMEQMVPGWTSAVQEMTEAFAGEEGFYGLCREAFNELDTATQDYEDDLRELQDTAGVTFDDLASGLDENIEKTQELIRNNEELINEYRKELDAIRAVIAEMNALINQYKAAEAAAKAATQAAYDLWKATQLANSGGGGGGSGSGSGGGGGGNPGGGSGGLHVGAEVTYTGGTYYHDSYGTAPSGSRGPGKKVTVTAIKTDGRPYPIHVMSSDSAYGWLKQSQLSFDTGGYTGEWANGSVNGRVALLHQKELVLNEHDTANMLAAVNIVRDIGSLLGRITGSLTGEMFNMFASSTMGPSAGMTGSSGVEQKVQIDATFPNVTSSSEIENALRNLVNVASQYASTNKR